jgi:hypothetical protein
MQPLPIAGGPSTTEPAGPATLISSDQAAAEFAAEGRTFEQSDAVFRSAQASAARQRPSLRLRSSVWVHAPTSTAPLGSVELAATAGALASSVPLAAFHHLVVTAVGLTPAAVPTGGVGSVSTTCVAPVSVVPTATPTVVPPTGALGATVTVTNCGNVPEVGVSVSLTVAPTDAPGAAPPPSGRRGGRSSAKVAMASGSSSAPLLASLPVAQGHRYTVTVKVSLPAGQVDPTGSTQQFLVYVTP